MKYGVLDLQHGGAVRVPDAGDPNVVVDVDAAVVDVEFPLMAGEAVEGIRRLPPPVFRYALGPCHDLGFDFGGVVEDGHKLILGGKFVSVS